MSKANKILLIIFFNLIIIIAEITFGLLSNSFALIADALHNIGDVMAIIVTYIAIKVGSIKSSFKYTYGFIKAEMMAAFVNTLFLILTMFYLIYEAIQRFFEPEVIDPLYMIIVGFIAFIANALSAYLLDHLQIEHHHDHHHGEGHHHHHEADANIHSAYLHMLSDALISLGVVVAGIFIYYFHIYSIDSILTILFSLYIVKHSYPLLKRSFLSLIDANITDISPKRLDTIIKADSRVIEYHDLHISSPSSKDRHISFHLVLNDENITLAEAKSITKTIEHQLEHEGFNHILIQIENAQDVQNSIGCIKG
jgi:cobalt-zinc-cadmium efflux system protein